MDIYNPIGRWRSRTTVTLALTASAVGLGNIWRFSSLASDNGGAPFVIAYLVCLFAIAVPILVAEVALGTHGRSSPVEAVRFAADRSLISRHWQWGAVLGCITGLLILGYQAVVAGWSIYYATHMKAGALTIPSPDMAAGFFADLVASPGQMILYQSLFFVIVGGAVTAGLHRGIAPLLWFTVPTLTGLLGILIALGVEQGDLEAADRFLFRTHWSDFTGDSVLLALGHAFYTLGIGVAAGISFGSYAPDRFPIGRAVLSTAVVDTLIAIAAGLAIFPLLLAFNAEPAAGPGLVFISIPYALGNMAQGALAGTLFFCVVVLALVGSAVALLEPSVAVLMQQFRLRRRVAAPILVALVWLLSAVVALSLGGTGPSGLLVGLDSLTSRFLLPISALITTTFVAFCMHEGLLRAEFARESDLHYHTWHLLVRFVSVPAIVIILFWNLASR